MGEQATSNLFRAAARYYDLVHGNLGDVGYYLGQAERTGGPILELACGTGRVTLPLVRVGHEVWGLDLSNEMLAELEKKRRLLHPNIASRLHVIHGDMCRFDLDRRFRLILIPFRAFQALTTPKQQADCLASVRRHLAPDGFFIVDVFRPYTHLDQSWVQPETLVHDVVDPETGLRVRCYDHRRAIDVKDQIIYPNLVYRVIHPDGTEETIVESLALSYFYENQMRDLLCKAGFLIIEEAGDFAGNPIGQGGEMIFLCRRGEEPHQTGRSQEPEFPRTSRGDDPHRGVP